MRRRFLLLGIALLGCMAWPAQGFAASAALVLQTATVAVPGSQFQLDLTVSRGRYFGDASPDLSFQLARSAGVTAAEVHVVQFALPPWALTTAGGPGSAQLHTEGWLGSWGSIDMSFRASGKATPDTRDVGSCSSVRVHVLEGRLVGKLVLKLHGAGNLRLSSIPVRVVEYPSLPAGCLSQAPPSCASGNSTASDGTQLLAELQLDTFLAGPQPAAPEVSEFYLDATDQSDSSSPGSASSLVLLGFLDSPQATRPATVIHYLLLESPFSLNAAAATATLTGDGSLASGSLSFAPATSVSPRSCGDFLLVDGSVSGTMSASFSWGGTREFSGSTAATLTFVPSPAPLAPGTPAAWAAAAPVFGQLR
ncbi:MAG: hypothetical protein ACXVZW_10600 [Gaiellaceae bacterium]